jgi:acetoin utilization deacetylase AcuC-like enzyme
MLLFSHGDCLKHETGLHHPERPARLTAIDSALSAQTFASLDRREAPMADPAQLCLGHPEAFVEQTLAVIPSTGLASIDGDTVVSAGSRDAALRAAGAICAAVDAVMGNEQESAFCAVRPPGHHAEPDRAMGFCLFNNAALGAFHARERHGIGRVAVIDFDVHHGNGTQAAFQNDGDLFYASTHQWPLYPGTGAASETGVGNLVNVPLAPGSGSREFRAGISETILPALENFDPELIILSAGFDAHRDDPLAGLNFVEEDFAWVTTELLQFSQDICGRGVISTLEGGYDLDALGASAAAHVKALMPT